VEIRKLESKDIERVVELWYETSIVAHDFISPEYWVKNKDAMANEYLPNSETYLAIKAGATVGFIAMVDDFLAAIFVQTDMQGEGIGKRLLELIKENREMIQLKVYKKNLKSIRFYEKQGFKHISENKEKETDEIESLMEWKRKTCVV